MAKQQADIRRWALIGAEQRLVELAEEASAIHRAFPELRQGGIKPQGGGHGIKAAGEKPPPWYERTKSFDGQPLRADSARCNPLVNWEVVPPDYFAALGIT